MVARCEFTRLRSRSSDRTGCWRRAWPGPRRRAVRDDPGGSPLELVYFALRIEKASRAERFILCHHGREGQSQIGDDACAHSGHHFAIRFADAVPCPRRSPDDVPLENISGMAQIDRELDEVDSRVKSRSVKVRSGQAWPSNPSPLHEANRVTTKLCGLSETFLSKGLARSERGVTARRRDLPFRKDFTGRIRSAR